MPCFLTAWSISSTTCSGLIQPCGWNTRLKTPCLRTTQSSAAFMSSSVLGLAGLFKFCPSQSLGTMQGNSQHEPADHVGIGVVLDRVDERRERNVLAEPLLAVGIEDQVARAGSDRRA